MSKIHITGQNAAKYFWVTTPSKCR